MTTILIIYLTVSIIQISYWIFYYFYFYSNDLYIKNNNNVITSTSIVICVKNEETNIRKNFQSWMNQLNPDKDELIIVDDFSTDSTYDTIIDLSSSHPSCQCIKSTLDRPGKKQALTDGIKAASKAYILLTDADCHLPAQWKRKLTSQLSPEIDFVLGYAPFYQAPGFLNIFQRFECTMTAIQYVSYAQIGSPYMGVGRNMLFRKSIFNENIYDDHIASGDDDLLVSSQARKDNTIICLEPASFVFSDAPPTFRKYWKQKLRHISSSQRYKPRTIFFLSLFSSSQIAFHLLSLLLVFSIFWKFVLLSYFLRLIAIGLVMKKAEKLLHESNLFNFTPILDISLSLYYLILTITYPFKNKKSWS